MRIRPGLLRAASTLTFVGGLLAVGYESGPAPVAAQSAPAKAAADATFKDKIVPFLNAHCNSCHNSDKADGGLALDVFQSEAHAKKARMTWETIRQRVAAGEMPPKKKPQPSKAEKDFVLSWIDNSMLKLDCTAPKDPGRVTLRRLNRTEYNNTVRDLCGVTIKPADDFPADDVGYGFDNIGDVLSVQPILLEKYMTAADKVLNAALVPLDPIASTKQSFRPQNIQVTPRSARSREDRPKITFTTQGEASLEKFNFPATGEYVFRVRAWGQPEGGAAPEVTVRVDGKDVKSFKVEAKQEVPSTYEATDRVRGGERRVTVVFDNPSTAGADEPRTLGLMSIEVEGPIGGAPRPLPDSAKLILTDLPTSDKDAPEAAKKVLTNFARRAFRRPPTADEVARLMKLFDLAKSNGEKFEQAIKLPLKAVLVSPHFLFRIEDDPKDPSTVRKLDDFELASRLSYFLWSTMPDEELLGAAARGELSKPGGMKTQIARMIADPKSSELVKNFAGQWLQLRNLDTFSPDRNRFGTWDDSLRSAMARETELYFEHVLRNDRSVLEFLDSDYSFLNNRLARHYGITGVYGPNFREVKMADGRRGGVVTHASVLTVTSNPTRTSPVKRGKWVYENILGLTAPPPAPDVPELPPVGQLKGTLRQQMEQHRANPNCSVCHDKLDPLGFGLENFDAIGAWRDQDNNKPVDASGVLPDGAKFSGPAELRKVLLSKSDLFRRCLAEKMLTYALGRGLEYYDKCVVDEIVAKLKAGDDKFSALLVAITETDAFRTRKGQRSE